MNFSIHQASHIGNRKYNQDRVGFAYNCDSLLLVLADGMGGHLHGEKAAEIAVHSFINRFALEASNGIADPQLFLADTLTQAHHSILKLPHTGPAAFPGTTCISAIVRNNILFHCYAGDSRLYVLRDGEVVSKTRDHSLVQTWIEWGKLTPEQARLHPQRNQITNCLGGVEGMFFVERGTPMLLKPGDVILLGSDGLWGPFSDKELAQAFRRRPIPDVLDTLIELALDREQGHSDNTTGIAMRWEEPVIQHTSLEPVLNILPIC